MPPEVLITGAARGIGLGLARGYAAAGARVTATHRPGGTPQRLRASTKAGTARAGVARAQPWHATSSDSAPSHPWSGESAS